MLHTTQQHAYASGRALNAGLCLPVQRNYRFFLSFLFVTTTLDCLVFAFCWVRLAYLTDHGSRPSLAGAIRQEPANIVLIGYTFLAFWWASSPVSPRYLLTATLHTPQAP